jgi:hypothetical protein
MSMLDDDVRAIAGKLISVYDTPTLVAIGTNGSPEPAMTLRMENICGSFPGSFENYPSSGALLRPGAAKVGEFLQHRQFVGTHHLFHTVHARLSYRACQKVWNFKGCRSLQDLVSFVRDLTEDTASNIYPNVNMLSVTLRTDTPLVIDPAHSLMQRVLEKLYSHVVRMQPRCDDTNNLFFFEVISWDQMIKVVTKDNDPAVKDDAVEHVKTYMAPYSADMRSHPTVSIGYTRKGVFFIRITFPRGCICVVESSVGVSDTTESPRGLCVGGVEPFVQIVVRFIILVLVKLRVVGVH